MPTFGISTAYGFEGFLDSSRPNEIVLAKGSASYNAAPIFSNTTYGCSWPIEYNGNYHVPVTVTLTKSIPGEYYLGSFPSRPYFYNFNNCSLVAGDSAGRSVGYYGGANHPNVVTPCGYSKALWSETATHITVKYFGIWSGTESSWRSSAHMSGTVYVMLVGQLPIASKQAIPKHGILMYGATGSSINFNSNYEPSNPKHFIARPNYNLNNFRTNTAFHGNMDGGVKMTTIAPVAQCHAGGSQNHYHKVWPCFSSDGRRIGTRTQGWAAAELSAPPSWNARTDIMTSSQIMRVWNVSDYF